MLEGLINPLVHDMSGLAARHTATILTLYANVCLWRRIRSTPRWNLQRWPSRVTDGDVSNLSISQNLYIAAGSKLIGEVCVVVHTK